MVTARSHAQFSHTRRCFRCGETKSVDDFRFRRRESGLRHGDCRDCHCAAQRALRARHRRRGFDWLARTIHHRRDRGADRLGTILGAMADKMGGAERFAAAWVEDFEEARRSRAQNVVFKHCRLLMELTMAYSAVRGADDAAELTRMPSVDLESELNARVVELLISAGKTDPVARSIVGELEAGWSGMSET